MNEEELKANIEGFKADKEAKIYHAEDSQF